MRIWSWQHVSVNIFCCWVEPSLLLSCFLAALMGHRFYFCRQLVCLELIQVNFLNTKKAYEGYLQHLILKYSTSGQVTSVYCCYKSVSCGRQCPKSSGISKQGQIGTKHSIFRTERKRKRKITQQHLLTLSSAACLPCVGSYGRSRTSCWGRGWSDISLWGTTCTCPSWCCSCWPLPL